MTSINTRQIHLFLLRKEHKPMRFRAISRVLRRWFGALSLLALLIYCAGCQTFSLTEEEYFRQQNGEMVDPETGAVVGVLGTAGYLGGAAGQAIAGSLGK
jgi:hypothetical protein